ncbi:hypothetical protein K450DRAFT_235046 [Umbelopsis ramanniana AG]|uniref:BRO1 domain-containing protein n=1 Tax=Umbelopsis ramanniana AG TaxID=1314678 RepID=A0AAD5EEN2_UMBRA|nr:uncharacterized protein K450DRAFT_235046 [Umbelopsis ramanniana AG]KAI8580885.1 hypothetical protein K450DRAFT_235046 [Umbelopsis ramanniana AG]
MTALLSLEGKKTDPAGWTPFIKQYIAESYAESPDQYSDECAILDQLRSQSVNIPSHPNVLARLQQYYAQLAQLMTKFPLDIGIQFSWYPIAGTGAPSVGHKNGYYEKACVLFSIASMFSELACSESKDSPEGARQSCLYFQNAAGCYQHLRDVVIHEIRVPPPADMSHKSLTLLSTLMLAQAQECSWRKALLENVRHGAIARLAIKLSEFYLTLADILTDDGIASLFPSSWALQVRTKAHYFEAIAHHRKGIECEQNGKFGEQITRLQLSDAALKLVQQDINGSQSFWGSTATISDALLRDVHDLQEMIAEQLASAIRDNDSIYMDIVPQASQVALIPGFEIVKPLVPIIVSEPFNELDLAGDDPKKLKPLFTKLVPFAVHQAISVYVDRKDLLLKMDILKKIKELDEECNSTLQDLGLPSSLEALVQPTGLPDSILLKAEEIQHEGGCQALYNMFDNVEMLSTKNAALIDEAVNELGKEHDEDERLRRRFRLEWIRPTSISLTAQLLEKGDQLSQTLENARNADKIVREKLKNWSKLIDLLSLPEKIIEQSIPSGTIDETQGGVGDDIIQRLQSLVDECYANIRDRQRIADEAQSMSEQDDISPLILKRASELSDRSSTVKIETSQFDPLFTTELGKYNELLKQVKKHSQEQWVLLNKIKDANNDFTTKRKGSGEISRREKALQNLEQAYLKFKEIRTNLVEGIKFHSQFSKALMKYRNICVDFVVARQLEAEELTR